MSHCVHRDVTLCVCACRCACFCECVRETEFGCACVHMQVDVCLTLSILYGGVGGGVSGLTILICLSVSPDFVQTISSEPFVTKLGVAAHHHDPECHAKSLPCNRQGHSGSSCNQNSFILFRTGQQSHGSL